VVNPNVPAAVAVVQAAWILGAVTSSNSTKIVMVFTLRMIFSFTGRHCWAPPLKT
jgi:hypothetical protein